MTARNNIDKHQAKSTEPAVSETFNYRPEMSDCMLKANSGSNKTPGAAGKNCSACNNSLTKRAVFCPSCGRPTWFVQPPDSTVEADGDPLVNKSAQMLRSGRNSWYYQAKEREVGPLQNFLLKGLIAEGRVNGETMLWHPGLPGWARADQLGLTVNDDKSTQKEEKGYYLYHEGRQYGPYQASELQDLVNQGWLQRGDLVWEDSFTDWKRADDVGLFSEAEIIKKPTVKEYFLDHEGKQYGPYGLEELQDLVNQGWLQRCDLVWEDSFTDWKRADEAGLFSKAEIIKKPAAKKYYIDHEGKQYGPYGLEELQDLVNQGWLQRGDLVWEDSFTDWKRASQLEGLF